MNNFLLPNSMIAALCLISIACSANVLSGDWDSSVEFGYNRSTGNSDSEDMLARLTMKYTRDDWWSDGKVEIQRNSDDGEINDETVIAKIQTNYNYNDTNYWFGSFNFLYDEFASFDRQASFTVGWGRHLIKTELTVLDLEFGTGTRFSRESSTGDSTTDAIFSSHVKWAQQMNENTSVGSNLRVEMGSENTYTVFENFMRVRMAENLGLKLSYLVESNSTDPDDTKHTDTETRLTIQYDF